MVHLTVWYMTHATQKSVTKFVWYPYFFLLLCVISLHHFSSPLCCPWLWTRLSIHSRVCLLLPHVLTNVLLIPLCPSLLTSPFFFVPSLSFLQFHFPPTTPHLFICPFPPLLHTHTNMATLPPPSCPQASSFPCSCCGVSWSRSDGRTRLCSTGPWHSHANWVSQMSSCQVRRQRAVGGNGDREVQGGGGDQRTDGLEEWNEGTVTFRVQRMQMKEDRDGAKRM